MKCKTRLNKLTVWVLTAVMLITLLPVTALATDPDDLNFEATPGDGVITVTWDKLEEKDVNYIVFSSDSDGENYTEHKDEYQCTDGKYTYVIEGLENNKTYTVGVEAVSESFEYGSMSAVADETPYSKNATVPGVPIITELIEADKTITVSWKVPANDGGAKIIGYEIECWPEGSTDGNGGMTIGVDADVFSYTIDELPDENISYDIKICAINPVGRGEYGILGNAPKVTGISFKTDSAIYNEETNTYTVSQSEPFVVYLTGVNFENIDESFLNDVHFGFVPSVENSENALGASLSEFAEVGIAIAVDSNEGKITLAFDHTAMTGFLGDESAFEGIGYGDINSFKEDDIKAVNITAEKSDLPSKKEFADVHPINHWAKENIDYVYENGLMNGTDDAHFAPDMPLTRAMLVTILYRLEGEPRVSGITSYADLEPGQYYLDAVCWAQINCIANGITETEFAPNSNITREQIAAIMLRYAKYKETAPTGVWAIRLDYADLAEISDYALEGVMFCKLKGIMQGKGENNFAPKDNATRTEAAAILERLIKSGLEAEEHECEEIAILYTNDVHCGIEDNIGYAGLAAYIKEAEALYEYVTLADCGDAIQGDFVGTVSNGEYIVDIMNELEYDFAVLGNHEFDYGMEQLSSLIEKSNAQYLGCNISYTGKNTNLLEAVKPYEIVEYGDTKVAFIGITTPESYTKSTPSYFMENGEYVYDLERGNDGKDLYANVQKYVDECENQGADYIIVLAHLGDAEESSPYTSVELIEATDGIDVVLDGHSHSVIESRVVDNINGENVVLSSTGTKLENIGKLVICEDGTITTELISDYTAKDTECEAFIESIKAKYADEMNEVIAASDIALSCTTEDGIRLVRNRETAIGNFCADAYRAIGNADIGVVNGGGIRADLPKGDITYADMLAVHPFGNSLCVVKATGQEIIDLLETACMHTKAEFKENGNAVGENGGFMQVSGLKFTIDTSIPSSVVLDENDNFVKVSGDRRVKDILVLGESGEYSPIEANQIYTLASHNYLLRDGGDNYTKFTDNEFVISEGISDYQVITEYITNVLGGSLSEKYAATDGRITVK